MSQIVRDTERFELRSNLLPFIPTSNRVLPYFHWVFLAAIVGGCSVGDFIGAYFNTYYNAQRLFSEAETEVLTAHAQAAQRQLDKPFLQPYTVQPGTKTKFNLVIEKCSKLLQYHPEVSLVDDALLMIGKSYFYQNEYQKAERKFKELIEGYPKSGLAPSGKLLLAQTYYKMNEKPSAVKVAKQIVEEGEQEDVDEFITPACLLLGYVELENKNYKQAREFFQMAAEKGQTDEQRSNAHRLVAEMYALETDYQKAAQAYKRSYSTSDNYISEFRAQIGYARMLSKLGRHEESLSELEDLLSDTNNKEFFGEISLEIGNVYNEMGDLSAAIEQYTYVDTAYARTETAANSYYQLGLLYETRLFQYDSARILYNRGRIEFPQAPVTTLLTQRAEYLNKYSTFRNEITKYDSIKAILLSPIDTTVTVSKTIDTLAIADSLLVDGEGVAMDDTVKVLPPARPTIPLDSVEVRLAMSKTELAGLFYTTIVIADSAAMWYRLLLTDHPGSIHVPRALFTLAQIYRQDTAVAKTQVDSLLREVISRHPESEFAAESRRLLGLPALRTTGDPAAAMYSRGEELMNSGKTSAAIDTFRALVRTYQESPIASKAQYAISWIYEEMKTKPDSAISNYQRLIDLFPASQYATLARPKLAEVEAARRSREAPTDTLKSTDESPAVKLTPEQVQKKEVDPEELFPEGDKGSDQDKQVSPPTPEERKQREKPRPQ